MLLQPSDAYKKHEKFIKHKTFPGKHQFFPVCRKMDVLQRIVDFRQSVLFPQTSRQIFPFHLAHREGFRDCLCDRLIAKSLRLSVNRLHRRHDFRILFRAVDLRLLHRKSSPFFYHTTTENKAFPRLERPAQIGHIVPCQRQCASAVPQSSRRNLQARSIPHHIRRFCQDSADCRDRIFLQFRDRLRFLKLVISTRVIMEQFFHRFHAYFLK